MKTFFVSALLLALAACANAAGTTVDMCPNRCNPNRAMSERECNHPVTLNVCQVDTCDGGFICRMPRDSFIMPNVHLPLVELVVEYSWGEGQSDLDTSTRFLDGNVGFSCTPDNDYLGFGGDDTSHGGKEIAVVDIGAARADGKWSDSTSVAALAGWHGNENEGDVTLKAFLRYKRDLTVYPGAVLSSTVTPGAQYDCAATEVGTVEIVSAQLHTRFTLQA